nr:HAD family phosphatase [Murinocardiopsis flavida]
MDGTLVNSEPLWGEALEEFVREHGATLTPEVLLAVVGTDDRTTMRVIANHLGRPVPDAVLDEWHDDVVGRVLRLLRDRVEPLPGAMRALAALHAEGVPMALVTSSPREVTDLVLPHIGGDRFAAVVTSADVVRRKPDPEPYLTAAKLLDVDPGAAWAVEDSPSGAASAEAAGCTVLLAPGAAPGAASPGRIALRTLDELAAP